MFNIGDTCNILLMWLIISRKNSLHEKAHRNHDDDENDDDREEEEERGGRKEEKEGGRDIIGHLLHFRHCSKCLTCMNMFHTLNNPTNYRF